VRQVKLVLHPAVEPERLGKIVDAARPMAVVNAQSAAEARSAIADADAFFGKITPALLASARQLRWVQAPTASLEHYMFPELVDHPCVLTNMRGLYSDVIADHVFGYVLCFARNFHHYIRNQLEARWAPVGGEPASAAGAGAHTAGRRTEDSRDPAEPSGFVTGPAHLSGVDRSHLHLADQTLGVVGLGQIGSEIARRGLAFGMRVLAVDPVQTAAPPGVAALWRLDRLPELLRESDFVVIAAPHTPETVKLFRRAQFRQMKPSAYLINIGRGAIVDLGDLVASLRAAEIGGAGLDVYETEPLPPDHPLWRMPNVILTPHVAGNSPRIAERHLAVLLENVRRFARGEALATVVDKRRWF
jgi:phosphoglycerate dehydrogenase-like enzyme